MTRLTIGVIIILLLAACGNKEAEEKATPLPSAPPPIIPSENSPIRPQDLPAATVKEVLSGDTISLEDGRIIRLIGINAPEEGQLFYEESKNFLQSMISGEVGLEVITEAKNAQEQELYFVWAGDQMVNWNQVRNGMAHHQSIPPNLQYDVYFVWAQDRAMETGTGIWQAGEKLIDIMAIVDSGSDSPDDEYVQIVNITDEKISLQGYSLYDADRQVYEFGDISLSPGQALTLFSGCGESTPVKLYWCSSTPIWEVYGDIAILTDAQGKYIDHYKLGN